MFSGMYLTIECYIWDMPLVLFVALNLVRIKSLRQRNGLPREKLLNLKILKRFFDFKLFFNLNDS